MAEDRIGNYRLFDEIGRGGMGILYKAEQTNLGRFVALSCTPTSPATPW